MENTDGAIGEISNGSRVGKRGREEGTRYTRFTEEQSEALEKVFAECPFPDQILLTRILVTEPILSGLTIKQLRVWFQNRRSRDRQRRGNEELVEENKRLVAGNNTLKQKNDGLQGQVNLITIENESLRNCILSLTSGITASDVSHEPVSIVSQRCSTISDNIKSLHSLAEEIKNEFITKAIGTAINWNPIPVQTKLHGSGSPCEIYISSACVGVAVRACTALPFEPMKVVNILKDRLSWSRDCRGMNVVAKYRATNAGVIEIIYTQYYAPTTMAFARDFWTMRYSSILDDGSFLVCERSISGSNNVPSLPATREFVRCKMLASGYLVRSCDGGSTITIVDHLDLESLSVPELVRPLYTSPEIVAKRMTLSALHYVRQLANKTDGETTLTGHSQPTNLRSLSKRLCRGFNDAVNGHSDDGWKWMSSDASKEFIISMKQTHAFGANATDDGIICVKTSLLLHNFLPASLVKLLKEHRSAWMNFNFANHSAAFSKAARRAYPSFDTHNLSGEAVTLCSTGLEDEAFEVIRFERYFERCPEISSGDIRFMQISSGMEDTGFGACSELIFAPFERCMPDDTVLLCSGFRIYLLGTNTNESQQIQHPSLCTSLLILAFQFPSGTTRIQEKVATTARKYVRHVISSVKKLCSDALRSESNPEKMSRAEENPASLIEAAPESNLAADLAVLITESCRSMLGVEMLGLNLQTTDSVAQLVQNHQYAILCFSFSSVPVIFYANQAALDMLGTTTDKLQHIPVDRILGGSGNVSLSSILPTIMQQGFTILPSGCYISETNDCVTYDEAILWQVRLFDGSIHCLAAAFTECMPFI